MSKTAETWALYKELSAKNNEAWEISNELWEKYLETDTYEAWGKYFEASKKTLATWNKSSEAFNKYSEAHTKEWGYLLEENKK